MEMKCPVCGAPMENSGCGYCGYIKNAEMQMPVYPNNNFQTSEFIAEHTVTTNNTIQHNMGIVPGVSRKSKTIALLLCIFLGGLGAHKFYVGKVGMGFVYLFTIGLFGVGWIIDIILIATGSFRDEFDLPLR